MIKRKRKLTEEDEQIASNLLEGQIQRQPQILDLPSRNQV
jgi:hypothetical protein